VSQTVGFTVNARYRAKAEHLDDVLQLLARLAQASRQEPGSITYKYFQSPEDPQDLLILEEYPSEAEFQAHLDSEHFRTLGREGIIPLLESRTVGKYPTSA
jgi:quinol monooxygenase YgiN